MQPRPLESVKPPLPLMQYWPSVSPVCPMRFCPSPSWSTWPPGPPSAVRWKQQPVSRVTKAWATADSRRSADFIFASGMGMEVRKAAQVLSDTPIVETDLEA